MQCVCVHARRECPIDHYTELDIRERVKDERSGKEKAKTRSFYCYEEFDEGRVIDFESFEGHLDGKSGVPLTISWFYISAKTLWRDYLRPGKDKQPRYMNNVYGISLFLSRTALLICFFDWMAGEFSKFQALARRVNVRDEDAAKRKKVEIAIRKVAIVARCIMKVLDTDIMGRAPGNKYNGSKIPMPACMNSMARESIVFRIAAERDDLYEVLLETSSDLDALANKVNGPGTTSESKVEEGFKQDMVYDGGVIVKSLESKRKVIWEELEKARELLAEGEIDNETFQKRLKKYYDDLEKVKEYEDVETKYPHNRIENVKYKVPSLLIMFDIEDAARPEVFWKKCRMGPDAIDAVLGWEFCNMACKGFLSQDSCSLVKSIKRRSIQRAPGGRRVLDSIAYGPGMVARKKKELTWVGKVECKTCYERWESEYEFMKNRYGDGYVAMISDGVSNSNPSASVEDLVKEIGDRVNLLDALVFSTRVLGRALSGNFDDEDMTLLAFGGGDTQQPPWEWAFYREDGVKRPGRADSSYEEQLRIFREGLKGDPEHIKLCVRAMEACPDLESAHFFWRKPKSKFVWGDQIKSDENGNYKQTLPNFMEAFVLVHDLGVAIGECGNSIIEEIREKLYMQHCRMGVTRYVRAPEGLMPTPRYSYAAGPDVELPDGEYEGLCEALWDTMYSAFDAIDNLNEVRACLRETFLVDTEVVENKKLRYGTDKPWAFETKKFVKLVSDKDQILNFRAILGKDWSNRISNFIYWLPTYIGQISVHEVPWYSMIDATDRVICGRIDGDDYPSIRRALQVKRNSHGFRIKAVKLDDSLNTAEVDKLKERFNRGDPSLSESERDIVRKWIASEEGQYMPATFCMIDLIDRIRGLVLHTKLTKHMRREYVKRLKKSAKQNGEEFSPPDWSSGRVVPVRRDRVSEGGAVRRSRRINGSEGGGGGGGANAGGGAVGRGSKQKSFRGNKKRGEPRNDVPYQSDDDTQGELSIARCALIL